MTESSIGMVRKQGATTWLISKHHQRKSMKLHTGRQSKRNEVDIWLLRFAERDVVLLFLTVEYVPALAPISIVLIRCNAYLDKSEPCVKTESDALANHEYAMKNVRLRPLYQCSSEELCFRCT